MTPTPPLYRSNKAILPLSCINPCNRIKHTKNKKGHSPLGPNTSCWQLVSLHSEELNALMSYALVTPRVSSKGRSETCSLGQLVSDHGRRAPPTMILSAEPSQGRWRYTCPPSSRRLHCCVAPGYRSDDPAALVVNIQSSVPFRSTN